MRRKKHFLSYLAGFLILLVSFFFLTLLVWYANSDTSKKQLPELSLQLKDASLSEIVNGEKSVKYGENSAYIVSNGDKTFFQNVEIKGRGNTTWLENKKPFRIKFNERVELYEGAKSKKWNLLANMKDDSSLRNDLSFFIAKLVDMDFTSLGEYYKLFIDGEELGLYYVTKPVEIGKDSVYLKDDYSILVELDNAYCLENKTYYIDAKKNCLVLKDARSDDNGEEAFGLFVDRFESFERAVDANDYEAVSEIMDIDSLVKYFLVSEFIANHDAFYTSFYFYMDGLEDKIHTGPIWDLDASFGNIRWANGDETFGLPYVYLGRKGVAFEGDLEDADVAGVPRLMFLLAENDSFKEDIKQLYTERLHNKKEEILDYLELRASYIRDEAIRDNNLWDKGDFDEEVNYLKWWIDERFRFFDELFGVGIKMPIKVEEI